MEHINLASAAVLAAERAAVLGGVTPLFLIAGVALLLMAAPQTSERLAELRQRLRELASVMPEPVRNRLDIDPPSNEDDDAETSRRWAASDAHQYREFFSHLADGNEDDAAS